MLAVTSGTIVFRQHHANGLQEVEQPFSSLEELFDLVVNARHPALVERIVIDGCDQNGNWQALTFAFHSITWPTASER